jgi:hypothetical protein
VNLPGGPYAKIEMNGSLKILNLLTVNGSFRFEVGTQGLKIHGCLDQVFGISLNMLSDLVINSSGVVFRGQLSLSRRSSCLPEFRSRATSCSR